MICIVRLSLVSKNGRAQMEKLRTELIMAAKQYVEPAHGENDEQVAQEAEQLKETEALKAQEEEAEQIRQAALRAREEEDE